MKNSKLIVKMVCSAAICGLIFAGCGGGSGSSSGSSSSGDGSKSAMLGSIPAIYKDYNAKSESLETKAKNAADEKTFEKLIAEGEALDKKTEEAIIAELKKIGGKDVPVSFSKALTDGGNLFFNVSAKIGQSDYNVKIGKNDGLNIKIGLTAKQNFQTPFKDRDKFNVYYRLVTTDAETLKKSIIITYNSTRNLDVSYSEGDSLAERETGMEVAKNPELWAKFAGIEFITKEEYDAAQVVK